MFKPSRIMVPTDMSEYSDKAIRQAFDIAKQFNSEVFLLHVIQDPIKQCTVDFCIDQEMFGELQNKMYQAARLEIKRQLGKFPYVDPDKITADVKAGVAYDRILEEAEERDIDLIVIASLGKSGLAKYLIGSVARHVLLGAKCSVLLTR
jgi:nucleotide-binding universal stress UspA family protein